MEIPDKSVVEAGADQRDDRGALERGIGRRHMLVEKTVPRSVRLSHGGSVHECRQFGNTLLPNWNLRWEAIYNDVLVAEHVTRTVRIMPMMRPLGSKLVDVVARDAGGMRLLARDAADLGDAIGVA
jgi:hypothetical protein